MKTINQKQTKIAW